MSSAKSNKESASGQGSSPSSTRVEPSTVSTAAISPHRPDPNTPAISLLNLYFPGPISACSLPSSTAPVASSASNERAPPETTEHVSHNSAPSALGSQQSGGPQHQRTRARGRSRQGDLSLCSGMLERRKEGVGTIDIIEGPPVNR